jgi:hypothetical protein
VTAVADVSQARAGRVAELARNEWVWLTGISVAATVFYVLYRAPVLNPGVYLDPWTYTGSMVNYGYLERAYSFAYYPSRLPWVLPGTVAHAIFGPVAAFFVLHTVFFFAAGLFAYLTVRRFFGTAPALTAYAALVLSPLFYDAYSNDYPDGALLTFLFGTVYFALSVKGARRPWLRTFWAGFFAAAAVGTNLFAGLVLATLLLLYAAVRTDLRDRRRIAVELGIGACGALALLVVCGSYARANGGEFLFFMPQVRELGTISPSSYKQVSGLGFTLSEPQFALPVFAAVAALVLAARRSRGNRFAVGAAASTLVLYLVLAVWEVAKNGIFFETPYYFSIFALGIALCLGAVFGLLRVPALAVPVAVVTAIVATVLTRWTSVLPTGRRGALVAVCLMAAAALAVATVRRAPVVLVALLVFTATYAVDAGSLTGAIFVRGTYHDNVAVQKVAFRLVDFLRSRGIQKVPFQFWYTSRDGVWLNGIQSMYFWGDSMVGGDLPRIDAAVRKTLEYRRPSALVLLCANDRCHGAVAALRRAGYPSQPLTSGVLSSGEFRVVVRVLRLPRFASFNEQSPATRFYLKGASPFATSTQGRAVTAWSFARGTPSGWSGDATAHGASFTTTSRPWSYELVGPKVQLPAGRYAVYARGRVLAGGLDLGVLDADKNAWLEQRFYWSAQRARFANGWMTTPFELTAATSVQVILSNWVPSAQQSRWRLGEIRLVRLR